MTDEFVIMQANVTMVFPLQLSLSDDSIQPNRRPIVAVLFRAGTPSVAPPYGADKRVVIDRQAIDKLELDRIIGLPFHATHDLTSHWEETEDGRKVAIPVGAIVEVERKDGIVYGRGFLWDIDHPDIVEKIKAASDARQLAISWEMVNVTMKDEGDYYRIYSFTPTGFALLRSDFAAYKSLMPALAAIADKNNYDPKVQPLAVLLDDHRLLHAYYATLRRGGTVSDWTLTEIVKMHAAIVDEMMFRHVQHRRGDGLSRTLNEESLPLQKFQFFTDEVERNVQDVWKVDKQLAKKWLKLASQHEKIELEDVDPAIPQGVPIAIQVDELIVAIGAIGKDGDSAFLSLPLIYDKRISAAKVVKSLDAWRERLTIASEAIDKLPDIVVVPGYIALTGSTLLTQHAKDTDFLICDNGVFRKLASYFSLPSVHFTLTDKPAGLAIPVYDVILVKKVRNPIEPVADEFTEGLVNHVTVEVNDPKGFVAARMRSLGDLDVYPQAAYITTSIPTRRGLLKITQETAEIHFDEGETVPMTYLLAYKPSSCLSAVAEVWMAENGQLALADCLWWNATKVADLPFPWRLSFVAKLAEAFMMPVVEWRLVTNLREIESHSAFVLQDAQAVYGADRLVVKVKSKEEVRR